jgi:hypothetical protein
MKATGTRISASTVPRPTVVTAWASRWVRSRDDPHSFSEAVAPRLPANLRSLQSVCSPGFSTGILLGSVVCTPGEFSSRLSTFLRRLAERYCNPQLDGTRDSLNGRFYASEEIQGGLKEDCHCGRSRRSQKKDEGRRARRWTRVDVASRCSMV